MEMTKDTIVNFRGSWGSGIATLVMEATSVICENSSTARMLDDCFGNVIQGHSVSNGALQGKEIVYFMDDMGITMAGFVAYDEWLDKGFPALYNGESYDPDNESDLDKSELVVMEGSKLK